MNDVVVGDDGDVSRGSSRATPTDTRHRCLETEIAVERDKGAVYGSSSELLAHPAKLKTFPI